MTSKPTASPACTLHEASDSYRGYWTPEDIAAQLAAISAAARREGRDDIAVRLEGVMKDLPKTATPPGAAAKASNLAAALDHLLPKIRDDRLHAALKAIRADL